MNDVAISIESDMKSDDEEWSILPTQHLLTRKRKRNFSFVSNHGSKRHKAPEHVNTYINNHISRMTKMYMLIFTILIFVCTMSIIAVEYYRYSTSYNIFMLTHNTSLTYSQFVQCSQYGQFEYIYEKCL